MFESANIAGTVTWRNEKTHKGVGPCGFFYVERKMVMDQPSMKSFLKHLVVVWAWAITLGVVSGGVAGANATMSDPDLNNDGVVNILDISLVGSCFGANLSTNPRCQVADTDGDGDVDMDDLTFVIAAFGQTGFPMGGATCVAAEDNAAVFPRTTCR